MPILPFAVLDEVSHAAILDSLLQLFLMSSNALPHLVSSGLTSSCQDFTQISASQSHLLWRPNFILQLTPTPPSTSTVQFLKYLIYFLTFKLQYSSSYNVLIYLLTLLSLSYYNVSLGKQTFFVSFHYYILICRTFRPPINMEYILAYWTLFSYTMYLGSDPRSHMEPDLKSGLFSVCTNTEIRNTYFLMKLLCEYTSPPFQVCVHTLDYCTGWFSRFSQALHYIRKLQNPGHTGSQRPEMPQNCYSHWYIYLCPDSCSSHQNQHALIEFRWESQTENLELLFEKWSISLDDALWFWRDDDSQCRGRRLRGRKEGFRLSIWVI